MAEEIRLSDLCHWTPKQLIACSAAREKKFTLFGGSRGPGKSRWLRWWLLTRLIRLFHEYKQVGIVVGLFCEDYPQLTDRQVNKIEKEFPDWLGELKETRKYGYGFHIHPQYGGGVLALRNLDKPEKYKSAEFAAIGVDELTANDAGVFDVLRGSLRWSGIPDSECKFVAATNPGGIGHLWVKQYWIDRDLPEHMTRLTDLFAYVPALPTDNPYLDSAYWDMLDTLDPDLARAWRYGDWDVFAGQAFKQFRRETHVCEPFTIPSHWIRWRATDWGFTNPWCTLWLTTDPDKGRTFVYREAYKTELTDRQQARLILSMTAPGENINLHLADPSMWTKKNMEDKTFSTADEYAAEGVYLSQADNGRLTGKRKVATMLMPLDDGRPGLMFFSTCENLIRTLPALPYDKVKVEDVDTSSEDHAYDTLRYGLSRINPRPVPKTKTKTKPQVDRLIKMSRDFRPALGSRDL